MYTFSERIDCQDVKVKTDDLLQVKLNTYLKFDIDPQTIGLLESEFIREVLTVKPTHIMPVPNKPSCVLGILARHRRVYWAVDLAMLIGLQPLDQSIRLHEVILISSQQLSLALVVPNILGTVRLSDESFENDFFPVPTALRPYLKAYTCENEKHGVAYLLKTENILQSSILHS